MKPIKTNTMRESYIFDMTFNNLIFEGRNKAYGAYDLRSTYNKHIRVAAFVATALFTTAVTWPLIQAKFTDQPVDTSTGITAIPVDENTIFILPPPPPEPEIQKEIAVDVPKEKIKTKKFTEYKVVKDDAPIKEEYSPTQEEISEATISTSTQDGIAAGIPNIDVHATPSTGTGGTGIAEETSEVIDYAEEMPAFVGGEKALAQFLSKNLRYPYQAQKENIEGLVVVSFVVGRDGKINDAQVLKGIGHGADEEAVRVISKMPEWKPGKQNGKTVPVRFTLPIRFSMKR